MDSNFKNIINLLEARFPGAFICKPGKSGVANGLEVMRTGRSGRAFVYEPSGDRFLLALHERNGETPSPEVWSAVGADEVVERIKPWAFPSEWQQPAAIEPESEARRLRRVANGLAARGEMKCEVAASKAEFTPLLTSDGKAALEQDMQQSRAKKIIHNFPWDSSGRLALDTTVLLNVYRSSKPPGKDRHLCLAAIGPARRRDEQSIQLQLSDLIVVNQTHNWKDDRWLWTDADSPREKSLGSRILSSDEGRQAALSLQLLDEGRIEEALALYGVTMSNDLHRLLGGERISPPACCAHPDESWRSLLVETLREATPWLLPRAVAAEAERLKTWAAEKKGRARKSPSLKLVIFPGQPHARKASLMLVGDVDGRNPRFEIEATASNARLADTAWKRPIDIDFERYGISALSS